MTPLSISVVIPTYNRAQLLPRSITSALREMSNQDELIVVDDGSTDDTEAVVSRFGNQIRYVRIVKSGAGMARNAGVEESKKELIAFLDSDDEYMPGRLELSRRLLASRPDILFTFSDMAGTTRKGRIERFLLRTWHQDLRSWDEILSGGVNYSKLASLPEGLHDFKVYVGSLYTALARAPYLTTITTTVRRESAGDALYFDEDWPLYEDWGCAGRLAKAGLAAYLEIETAWQHSHGKPRLTSTSMLTEASTRLELLKRIWGQDREYLATNGEEYQRLLDHHQILRVRQLFILGRRREAVKEIRLLARPSFLYKILAIVPGSLTRVMVVLVRPFRRLIRR